MIWIITIIITGFLMFCGLITLVSGVLALGGHDALYQPHQKDTQ